MIYKKVQEISLNCFEIRNNITIIVLSKGNNLRYKNSHMKTENWKIENGKLVCYYETYNGKKGIKTFEFKKSEVRGSTTYYNFFEQGTKYFLGSLHWCNLVKAFTPLYNNTKLMAFVRADLTAFA